MVKKHNVTKERIDRFAFLNEEVFERTAYAESQAYSTFKDLSLLQVHVIRLIKYHQPCTMGKLAKSMKLSLGSVTQLIDRLIKKDYVKRVRSTEDRRVVFAQLTAKGKKVIKASKKHVDTVAFDMLTRFTESEQKTLLTFLEKMVKE